MVLNPVELPFIMHHVKCIEFGGPKRKRWLTIKAGHMEISAHLIKMLATRIERRLNVVSAVVAMMFIAFSASGLYAQGYGTISGTVTDPSGASVASATVKAIQTQTGRETVVTSGREGDFVFPTLPPSAYSLSVSATGFQSYTQTDIILQADQRLTAVKLLNMAFPVAPAPLVTLVVRLGP